MGIQIVGSPAVASFCGICILFSFRTFVITLARLIKAWKSNSSTSSNSGNTSKSNVSALGYAQFISSITTLLYLSFKMGSYYGADLGCGGLFVVNGLIIWYVTVLIYFAVQIVKVGALLHSFYPNLEKAIKGVRALMLLFSLAMALSYSINISIDKVTCKVEVYGVVFDTVLYSVNEAILVTSNIFILYLLSYRSSGFQQKWIWMQKKFVNRSLESMLILIISTWITNENVTGEVVQIMFLLQLSATGYYTFYTYSIMLKMKTIEQGLISTSKKLESSAKIVK